MPWQGPRYSCSASDPSLSGSRNSTRSTPHRSDDQGDPRRILRRQQYKPAEELKRLKHQREQTPPMLTTPLQVHATGTGELVVVFTNQTAPARSTLLLPVSRSLLDANRG